MCWESELLHGRSGEAHFLVGGVGGAASGSVTQWFPIPHLTAFDDFLTTSGRGTCMPKF